MVLFLISVLLVLISSYFITSVIAPKKSILGLIYLFLIAFAQIVLTFEILSLFNSISQAGVLIGNLFFTFVSAFIWNKKTRPIWTLETSAFLNRFKNALKLDKTLILLLTGFIVFIASALFLSAIMPITNADALSYHVSRSLFWVFQGNLNHYNIADIRNLCLPINSEILYAWLLTFLKNDIFLGFFGFIGYALSMVATYNLLGLIGLCVRKKLWIVFMLSSFASVIVQASGTETDIVIAALVTSSFFLYWWALKHDRTVPVFMSSLAYALAIGTKTTSILAIPSVGIAMIALSIYYKKRQFYKPFAKFLGFGTINFLIFSSYNYVLNLIQFGNIMGSQSFIEVSKNYYGIKGMFANFVKYIFMFFDFTGFRWADYIGSDITNLRNSLLTFLHLSNVKDGIYTIHIGPNRYLMEPFMGAGILGFLVFLPCYLYSLIRPVFKKKSKKIWFVFGFAILLTINLISMSYVLAYMIFSVRFLMFFMILSSPVLIYSYFSNRNPLKYLIIFFSLFYMIGVSTHIWPRPLIKVVNILRENKSLAKLRNQSRCQEYTNDPKSTSDACLLYEKIKSSFSTKNKILVLASSSEDTFDIKKLEFEGYKMDFKLLEDAKDINFKDYNIIIVPNFGQKSTLVKYYDARKDEVKQVDGKYIIKKNALVPCNYSQNPEAPTAKQGETRPPYKVTCSFTNQFLEKNDMKIFDNVGVIRKKAGDYEYFVLYRNKDLPVHFIKEQ